jgi:two-component system, OmpR family, response regulator
VLVIDGEDASIGALVGVLEARGYAVERCAGAQDGYRRAYSNNPDCIVCNPELPDIDGAWVARKIRTDPGPLAKVPFVFVGEIDRSVRTQALAVGVDVFVPRGAVDDEGIVAQVDALVAMARRYAADEAPPPSVTGAAIRGDLSMFPLASVLMMFEMERRSGTVNVTAQDGKRATLAISDGLFASTDVDGMPKSAIEVLREVLSWRAGRFSFVPRKTDSLPAPRASVGAIVLEAMRLEDEAKESNPNPNFDNAPLPPPPKALPNR